MDSFLPYQDPTTVNRKLDSERLTVGVNTVERERVQIAGATATDIAPVTAADGLSVKVTNTVPVSALNLDIRDLAFASDKVDASGSSISVSSSALPAGAATAANQLPDGHNVTVDNAAGAAAVNVQDGGNSLTVDGAVTANAGLNLNTSALNLEATQADVRTALQIIDDWDETDRAKVNPIAGQAGVQGGAGASTALTQRVALATDANAVQGTAAHNAADTGNPQKIGGRAQASQITAVTDGVRTDAIFDRHGNLRGRTGHEAPAGSISTHVHAPVANTQATTTKAAGGSGVRHVCVGLTAVLAADTTAPAATVLTVELRDGASGAGTILWQTRISLPATAGAMNGIVRNNIWIPGTAATAMTLEFSAAGGANTFESVSMEIVDITE